MNGFNLSDWALRHRSLIWYLMVIALVAGVLSYLNLGREEDPAFAIKTMTVSASWPGASLDETLSQVTERIERKLEELDTLDYTKSVTTPGQTTVFVNLAETVRGVRITDSWTRVRNMMSDIRGDFPQGFAGFAFNDQFGDVFGNIYAFTTDGLTPRQLRDYVEEVRRRVLAIPEAGKIDILGAQDEVVYLEFSTQRIAALGLDQQAVIDTLQSQNAITPSGVIQAGPERIAVRVSGQFTSEESLRNVNLRVNDRFFRLSDVATISRGYEDPPQSLFRYGGKPAIGLAIGMKDGSNILHFGEKLKETMARVEQELPIGVNVHLVADQPAVVEEAVGGFTRALFEAIAIVLAVSFISLGFRAGIVVSLSIPLVLAMTFVFMEYLGINLQRISLGALIISLGLLVDDAMIAIETMVTRLEAGDTREKAAGYAWTSIAFPMLTGTLVTVAGFIPIGLNSSSAGEYTFSLFEVIAISLLLSWVVAVLFAPLLGATFLPKNMKKHEDHVGWVRKKFRQVLHAAMRYRWITIAATLVLFVGALLGFRFVQQQFFPPSDRPELIVDMTLRQNSTIRETQVQMDRLEASLVGDEDIVRWTSYVGAGAARFILSYDVQPPNPYFGQVVILTKSVEARERLRAKLVDKAQKEFQGIDVLVKGLELGPPVGRPIQYRLSGPDVEKVRAFSLQLADVLGKDTRVGAVVYDWNEPSRVIKVDILQDKARQLGVSSEQIASSLNSIVAGATVTQIRDSIYLVNVVGRAQAADRNSVEALQGLQLPSGSGSSVPLGAIATFEYGLEQPVVWRRSRQPTITLKASIVGPAQPATIVSSLAPSVAEFSGKLPLDYKVEVGGTVEDSGKSQAPIVAVVPLMLLTMLTLLMLQLQSFNSMVLVVSVAPLGLIGVVAALVPSGAPLGFVAILGVLALIGILIRNSVILVTQIDALKAEGKPLWEAVYEASDHRARPILLTAAAASLALIPISREIFWGPMAYAMMGGIIVGTLITLIFLPALYVAWFRVREPEAEPAVAEE
ncbi:efflux RND transporter permease subunit [Mesorhizobium sp. CGMCC 1.15528]|uniref:Efflux RND transporter permease subunit n=1 Tax=Mesorhizobium zhangyense TaxID=1776730 RepID=A0A7C9VDJ8_9HYPH|nr:efflux RND transporter permease subunit [Mesorhizobium zhangyense]NGN42612.1 efflux RND transporter permease subunit [Mesorhizobium zhangyense]